MLPIKKLIELGLLNWSVIALGLKNNWTNKKNIIDYAVNLLENGDNNIKTCDTTTWNKTPVSYSSLINNPFKNTLSAMSKIVSVVVPAGSVRAIGRLKRSTTRIIENSVLDSVRIGSANKLPDGQHGFNDIIDNYAGEATRFDIPTKGPGGSIIRTSELRQIQGSNNGTEGIFELSPFLRRFTA
jgi:hypothetical protein